MATLDEPTLHALARRILITINDAGRCLITQPAELAQLKAMGLDGLRQFAADHGWTVVMRLGGAQIEFFAVHVARARAGLV
ncbi:MAG TPA: hypothetical protein VHY22_04455 [Chthoniobacteraceae bacterium]|nr:hypothetical protein [Chthoniobacteraceae bacterium]